MINSLVFIAFYSGIFILALLTLKFIYQLIKKRKYLKTLRLLINFSVLLTFCYGAFMSLALVVRIPSKIATSKEQSLENLNQWVLHKELKIVAVGLVITILLGGFNYLYQKNIEKLNSRKPIITISILNCITILICLLLIYFHTFYGLMQELNLMF